MDVTIKINLEDNLSYFYENYLRSVKAGKPDTKAAAHLKMMIDVIQCQDYIKSTK